MKKTFWILASLGIIAVGNLEASSVLSCSLNGGGSPVGGCYSGAGSFNANEFLDWGSALGEALAPTMGGGASNPYNLTTSALNTQANGGLGVSVSLGPNASFSSVARIDNTKDAWDGSEWNFPDVVSQAEYGQNILTFAGHFGSPVATDPANAYQPVSTQFGDHLLGTTDSSGNMSGGGDLTLSFASTVMAVGFRISTNGGPDTNFDAILTAKNAQGVTIGTYSIADQGAGGICPALTPANRFSDPGTCNDAPWIGFIDPTDQIASVTIEAFDPATKNDLAFVMDTLEINTDPSPGVPEPGALSLVGGALAGLVWAKQRFRRAR